MYPGSKFEIIDQSLIEDIPQADPVVKPMFMAAFTSDKGSENYGVYEGDDFFKQFGTDIKFANHGQPLLQAAMAIKAGARLYCKRMVADDATLANLILSATITKTSTQKTNAVGQPIYITSGGAETTEAEGNTAVMLTGAAISYSMTSIAGVKSISEAKAQASSLYISTEDSWTFPIAVFADNGRGISKKRIRIEADYANSKSVDFTRYSIYIMEGNEILEPIGFAFNPDIVYDGASVSLKSTIDKRSKQIKAETFDSYILEMYGKVAELTEIDVEYLLLQDMIFGKTKDGLKIESIVVTDDVNLSATYGFTLTNGTNGTFGTSPINSPTYGSVLARAFDGSQSSAIYDLDNLKMYAIVDANYPAPVKRAIEKLVEFRQDTYYFRDLGTGLTTLFDIVEADGFSSKSMFSGSYHNSYDIIDPFSKKQITVTVGYDIAQLLVSHVNNGINRPFAGLLHGVTFGSIIEGTINFIPTNTPEADQKETLNDNRINYIGYYDGVPVMETTYTSYDKYSKLSFSQNVMSIQELIRAIRTKCPKIRYQFSEAEDLKTYQEDVQAVIDNYNPNFAEVTLEYYADERYEANNIFYAGLSVRCKNFIQSEYFKVLVL